MDATIRLIKQLLIVNIAVGAGTYSSLVLANLQAAPDYFVDKLGGGTGGTAADTLDSIIDHALTTADHLISLSSFSITDLKVMPAICALALYFFIVPVIAFTSFQIVLTKIAMAILIAVGPLFILGLLFEGTKKFFESWAGQVVTYALTSALVIAGVRLLFGMFDDVTNQLAGLDAADIGLASLVSVILIGVINVLVILQLPSIAAGLAGGVALQSLGVAQAAIGMGTSLARRYSNQSRMGRDRANRWASRNTATGRAKQWVKNKTTAAWMKRKSFGGQS